jgi:uncharacterized protein
MIQPPELKIERPAHLSNGIVSTTTKIWAVLEASWKGETETVRALFRERPELVYAQYNYTPPIHFAVRQGNLELVEFLLDQGAYDPAYRTYPFLDSLETIANERGFLRIGNLLEEYAANPPIEHFQKDNGIIDYQRTETQQLFEDAVAADDFEKTSNILHRHPALALDASYFWGEGILAIPVQHQDKQMSELLFAYGAKVPEVLKWTKEYYFKYYDSAEYVLTKGMNPNTMSWQRVTILHDMAFNGDVAKACAFGKRRGG